MIGFVPFMPAHLVALPIAEARAWLKPLAEEPGLAATVAIAGLAWTAIMVENGAVVGCAGIVPVWQGRATTWAFTGVLPRTAWVAVTRRAMAGLAEAHARGYRRIEAAVHAKFEEGHRWAAMLGFEPEGVARCYGPDGADHVLYARVAP
jgi:RimJ/RimL family protein N-acetyltransferase